MLVGLKMISYQLQNIFEIYSCKKIEYYSLSLNKNNPYFMHVYCICLFYSNTGMFIIPINFMKLFKYATLKSSDIVTTKGQKL